MVFLSLPLTLFGVLYIVQYLEEDRRRVAATAKEARLARRKDDRQLKEYVHTLEVHLDQVCFVLLNALVSPPYWDPC